MRTSSLKLPNAVIALWQLFANGHLLFAYYRSTPSFPLLQRGIKRNLSRCCLYEKAVFLIDEVIVSGHSLEFSFLRRDLGGQKS
jgi:hypothetical protein